MKKTTGMIHYQPGAKILMHISPRCRAKCKRTREPCRAPAMPNERCRLHGGKSTGVTIGNTNALKHGYYSAEAKAYRRELKLFLNKINKLMTEMVEKQMQ